MKSDITKRILKKIKQYETIVIARHVGPDPDAICSQVALRDFILENYPKNRTKSFINNIRCSQLLSNRWHRRIKI